MQESNLMNRGERVSKMQESPSQKPTGKNNVSVPTIEFIFAI